MPLSRDPQPEPYTRAERLAAGAQLAILVLATVIFMVWVLVRPR